MISFSCTLCSIDFKHRSHIITISHNIIIIISLDFPKLSGNKNTNTWAIMPILVTIYLFVPFGRHQSPTHIIGALTVMPQCKICIDFKFCTMKIVSMLVLKM